MVSFNDQYLNKTPNKTARKPGQAIEFCVWHETASPNPDNPHGTLGYNLRPSVQSSYHYLIARDGTIFRYLDPVAYIAWGAGVKSKARGYQDGEVNTHSINIELDGRNDGTAITIPQRDSMIALLHYIKQTFGIPLAKEYHLEHVEVAPGYKSDAKGYSITEALRLAQQQPAQPKPAIVDELRTIVQQLDAQQNEILRLQERHAVTLAHATLLLKQLGG